ncbi:MAG TPA: TonB-dependent receptor, partial [Nevskiaceae bacterium]|nr:TonB-dependent receptor [Nevskiaceae bacterium]
PATIDETDKGFNPKFALTWKPRRDFSIYGSAVRGFRFGGINAVTPPEAAALNVPITFKSDTLWNYELGTRTDWFNGRMTADLTVFYIDWKKPQILQLKAGAIGYTDNVGAARSQGVESQVSALLPWNLFASISGAYIDARTTEEFNSDNGAVPPGTLMPATPYVSGAGVLTHRLNLAGWQLLSSYTITYHGWSHNTLQNTTPLPAYVLHGLSLNVVKTDWSLRPELNFSVNNLADKHVPLFAEKTPGSPVIIANQPRTIALTLSLSY